MKNGRCVQLLRYAKSKGLTPITPIDLHSLFREYLVLFDPTCEKVRNQVLKEEGKEVEWWTSVVNRSGSFYFLPDQEMNKINSEIKKRIRKELGFLPPIMCGGDYLRAQLTGHVLGWHSTGKSGDINRKRIRSKNPSVKRIKINGRFHYDLI